MTRRTLQVLFTLLLFTLVTVAAAINLGGAGLGLAVARAIVEGHGGLLEVRSAIGEGSRFTIELPGLEAQLEDESADGEGPA